MAVKFGKDGTLYCNSVKYKYKQTRNIVPDGSYGQMSGVWSMNNVSAIEGTDNVGYRSYRAFRLPATTGLSMLEVNMPTPIAGHKYYGGCMYRTTGSEGAGIGGDTRFEWYIADSATGQLVFGHKNIHTGGKWKKLSSIQTLSSVNSGSWRIRQFMASSNAQVDVCRHIIIDLTEAFGAGNEPNKDWCDNNIREWDTFINWGSTWSSNPSSNIDTWYGGSVNSFHKYNYLSLDSSFEPREYMYYVESNPSTLEGYIYSNFSASLSPGTPYYISYDALPSTDYTSQTLDVYWPIAEPSCGAIHARRVADANGGGGMSEWRRFSWYNNRSSFSAGNYQVRLDLDNKQQGMGMRITAIGCSAVSDNVDQYNKYYGTSITLNDVNKEWCDRWIDHRSSPIIHIGDPAYKTISFNTSYDVICNDIEIRPEVNKVTVLPNGKIICKKLVKTQRY